MAGSGRRERTTDGGQAERGRTEDACVRNVFYGVGGEKGDGEMHVVVGEWEGWRCMIAGRRGGRDLDGGEMIVPEEPPGSERAFGRAGDGRLDDGRELGSPGLGFLAERSYVCHLFALRISLLLQYPLVSVLVPPRPPCHPPATFQTAIRFLPPLGRP